MSRSDTPKPTEAEMLAAAAKLIARLSRHFDEKAILPIVEWDDFRLLSGLVEFSHEDGVCYELPAYQALLAHAEKADG